MLVKIFYNMDGKSEVPSARSVPDFPGKQTEYTQFTKEFVMSRALFLPPRNGQSFALSNSSRDVRPGSDRHLEQIDRRPAPVNRIASLLPPPKPASGHIGPIITMVRVPGNAPLKSIVKRVMANRLSAAPALEAVA